MATASKCCLGKLTATKLQALVLCAAIVIVVCIAAQLNILRSFDKYTHFLQSDGLQRANGLLGKRKSPNSWGKNTFCYDFVLNTYHNDVPMCGGQVSKTDQVKCYVNTYTKYMAMCSYEGLAMRPRQMIPVIHTDSEWKTPISNRTINLLRYHTEAQLSCGNFSMSYLTQKTDKRNFEVKLTRHLFESERLSPVVCDSWINKTTFFHVSNGFHIYFRFLDLYNVHKSLLDYNISTEEGRVLRVGNMDENYLFPEFDKTLFPGALTLNDFKDNGTICFKKVILVPRSYQSVPFQCKMNHTLRERCFECNGRDLTDSSLYTFRKRVLKACNITSTNNHSKNSHLVFVSRKPYARWPSDDVTKFKRVLSNEALMIDKIKSAFPNTSIEVIHMEDLDMCEQVRYAVKADVMLGVHGAGLVHFWWLRDEAVGFELEPMFEASNPSFRMLATLAGRHYVSELIGGVSTEVSVNIYQLIESLRNYLYDIH